MTISDYDKVKPLEVTSADGEPTISRALAIKLTSGDDSSTGTGEIALDWSNIDGPEDIAVFDEDGNLLEYYFETLDASDEEAVVWVHRDWVRDGSVQAQVAYGNGPSDESVSASTVFGKESDVAAAYLFNEKSGDLIDVSGEGHDGNISGATQGENGVVGDAYQFDGSDDYVEVEVAGLYESLMDGSNEYTVLAWLDVPSSAEITGSRHDLFFINDEWDVKISSYSEYLVSGRTEYKIWDGDNEHYVAGSDIRDQGPTLLTAVYDPDDGMKLYEGSTLEDSDSWNGSPDHINDNTIFVGGNPNRQADTYEGFLSHLRIISSALSAEDIAAFYEATKQTPELFNQQAAETTSDGSVSIMGSVSDLTLSIESESIKSGFALSGETLALPFETNKGNRKLGQAFNVNKNTLNQISKNGSIQAGLNFDGLKQLLTIELDNGPTKIGFLINGIEVGLSSLVTSGSNVLGQSLTSNVFDLSASFLYGTSKAGFSAGGLDINLSIDSTNGIYQLGQSISGLTKQLLFVEDTGSVVIGVKEEGVVQEGQYIDLLASQRVGIPQIGQYLNGTVIATPITTNNGIVQSGQIITGYTNEIVLVVDSSGGLSLSLLVTPIRKTEARNVGPVYSIRTLKSPKYSIKKL